MYPKLFGKPEYQNAYRTENSELEKSRRPYRPTSKIGGKRSKRFQGDFKGFSGALGGGIEGIAKGIKRRRPATKYELHTR